MLLIYCLLTELIRQSSPSLGRNNSFVFQVTLVAHKNDLRIVPRVGLDLRAPETKQPNCLLTDVSVIDVSVKWQRRSRYTFFKESQQTIPVVMRAYGRRSRRWFWWQVYRSADQIRKHSQRTKAHHERVRKCKSDTRE